MSVVGPIAAKKLQGRDNAAKCHDRVYVCAPPGRRTVKDRAFARLARHCHVAAHHAGELAGDSKTKAGAAEALRGRGIGLGELLEQLCLLLRRHADASIGNG